jgi:hypothetical protein
MSAKEIIHYFKRPQRDGIYHFYEVYGGPGKTQKGKQIVINFLNEEPIIAVEHNYVHDLSGLTGTWCTFEVGIPISREEYLVAFNQAIDNPKTKII